MTKVKYYIYLTLIIVLLGSLIVSGDVSLYPFLDIPSFLFIIAAFMISTFTIVGLKRTRIYIKEVFCEDKTEKTNDALTYFRSMTLYILLLGFSGFLIGIIFILVTISDPSALGRYISVALLTFLYSIFFIVLTTIPFQLMLYKKL